MPIIGITGGIATGKSTFTRELSSRVNASFFDADRVAKELLEDKSVLAEVKSVFGKEVFMPDGLVDRTRLRHIVFADEGGRRSLEKILHPRIRQRWMQEARDARQEGRWYFVDIPLLYETGVEDAFDRVVVVACSAATQWKRLLGERGVTKPLAEQILNAQLPLSEKMVRADHLIWSDAPLELLGEQAVLLIGLWDAESPGLGVA